jgi:hypothetical protein
MRQFRFIRICPQMHPPFKTGFQLFKAADSVGALHLR